MNELEATDIFYSTATDFIRKYNLAGGKHNPRRIDTVDVVQYIWQDIFEHSIKWHTKKESWLIMLARKRSRDYIRAELRYRKRVRLFSDIG